MQRHIGIHVGIINAALMDGSVRTTDISISQKTWNYLLVPDDGQKSWAVTGKGRYESSPICVGAQCLHIVQDAIRSVQDAPLHAACKWQEKW
jgi:hypothetical protein